MNLNPKASTEEILQLSDWQQLHHPNCPVDNWWLLARAYPITAPQTPAGMLFLLEEPERWIQLVKSYLEKWIEKGILLLPYSKRFHFGTICAEHVLSIFTAEHPDDDRLAQLLGIRRRIRDNDDEVRAERDTFIAGLFRSRIYEKCSVRARNVVSAITSLDAGTSSLHAAYAQSSQASDAMQRVDAITTSDPGYFAERLWQWERLQEILHREGRVYGKL